MEFISNAARAIPGYEGLYAVTRTGVVYSLPRKFSNKLKIMTPVDNMKAGYLRVALTKDGRTRLVYIHRVVAQTYITNPDNKPMVNHIDGVKTNNRVENLEWVTGQENHDHAFRLGLYPKQKVSSDKKSEIFALVQQRIPVTEVAERYGMKPGGVYSLVYRYKEQQEMRQAA